MGETLKKVVLDGGERLGGNGRGQAKPGNGGEAAYAGKGGENQGEGGGDRYSWHGVGQEGGWKWEWEEKSNQGESPLLSDGQMVSTDAGSGASAGLGWGRLSERRFSPSMRWALCVGVIFCT